MPVVRRHGGTDHTIGAARPHPGLHLAGAANTTADSATDDHLCEKIRVLDPAFPSVCKHGEHHAYAGSAVARISTRIMRRPHHASRECHTPHPGFEPKPRIELVQCSILRMKSVLKHLK